MRFYEDGPSIPDLLLERRDQGRVVFLCGAGVSLNAGMPTFYKLTKFVVDFFDPPSGSAIELEFRPWIEDYDTGQNRPKTPLDQIFHLLYQEYGREEVNEVTSSRLRDAVSKGAKGTEHSVIARISSNQEGKPQIVTTNFDLLFESASGEARMETYVPPAFPDISLGSPLTGITYLHGRLQDLEAKQHPYVLSSADFGRAYLSEGWATKFIRSLLESYTVVLVGYKAEDPPVRYLLQGLNHDGLSDKSNLYAFDEGEPEDIEAKWRDRGVTAIACKNYPALWQSLEAWAIRSDDPREWRSSVMAMAAKSPRQLSAHERGQVAHLVRRTPGARLFANADPPPTSEWLCVFDTRCRVAKVSSDSGEHAETFDPFKEYGLDDDQRQTTSDNPSNWHHNHILGWLRGDANPTDSHSLGGREVSGFEKMPPRLFHLSIWITKHLSSPIAAWWAARQHSLHPRLVINIRRELQRNTDLHTAARRTWNLIIEYQSNSNSSALDSNWFELKSTIINEGWTSAMLRQFDALTAPTVSLEHPIGIQASKPPLGDWEKTDTTEIARWKVKLSDRYEEGLDIPDERLESVFRITEGHLHRASELLSELNTPYISPATCYPEREVNGKNYDRHGFFRWLLTLFARMITGYPDKLRGYAISWPNDEKFYFHKLKLFALNHADLFEADEAAESILAVSQECFWDGGSRRELLFLIGDRWNDFSARYKEALTERLLQGPDKMEHWSDGEYPTIRDKFACGYTRWLTLQTRQLSEKQAKRLDDMISNIPKWTDNWASNLVTENFPSVRSIGTDETPDILIDLPVNQIVKRAQAVHRRDFNSNSEKRPFTGLVKVNPYKAMASLSYLARRGEYPPAMWSALINNWPEDNNPRLLRVLLKRLGRFPHETIRNLRHPVGRWLQEKLLLAFEVDESLTWDAFDHLVSGLISEEGTATDSGIGEVRIGSEVIERSRRTYSHAINGPIGDAMQGLQNLLNSLRLEQEAEIPVEFKSRIEFLISSPGKGGDHAVIIIAHELNWLYFLDPKWVKEQIIPWFNFNHDFSEPAWNGYLSSGKFPQEEIGIILKPLRLDLFKYMNKWSWDENLSQVATEIAIELAIFRGDKPDGLNPKEARDYLRNINERERKTAIFRLSEIAKREDDGWSMHVIPFIKASWPRERKLRTSTLVPDWVSLLGKSEEKFPEVLWTVRQFLVPVDQKDYSLYKFSGEAKGDESLTKNYPSEVLELLDALIPNSTDDLPYDLMQTLDLIEETDPSLASDLRFVRLISLIEHT